MRATRFISASGPCAVLLLLAASAAPAQERNGRAPVIRVTSASGAYASNYIEPSIQVSENAYVFAVAIDVDGEIQVLHPEFPGISVRILGGRQLRLRNFFAGFSQRTHTEAGAQYVTRYGDYDPGLSDTRGTVIAIASREPFSLELLTLDGDWDISAIRRLIDDRDPSSAAAALARYLGVRGEPIGSDFLRFAGRPTYYASGLSTCDAYYGAYGYSPSYSILRSLAFARAVQLNERGKRVSFLGYDVCGQPIFMLQNTVVQQRSPATGAFPTGRNPARAPRKPTGMPRNPARPDTLPARMPRNPARPDTPGNVDVIEEGFMRSRPVGRVAGRADDRIITASTGQRVEPRGIPEQYRGRPTLPSMPDRTRNPVELRPAPRRETISQGVRAVPEHRPITSSAAPAPLPRASGRMREAPPPAR